MSETSRPSEDGGNWVGASALSLLPHSVVSSDSSVSSLRLHASVLIHKNRGHETKRAESLSNNIGLHITIVVLASPDDATLRLDSLGNHIVNKSVLVVNTSCLELVNEFLLVDTLKGGQEETIVLLKNGVLGGELKRVASAKGVLHARSSERFDGSLGVEHTHVSASSSEIVDFLHNWFAAVSWSEHDLGGTWFVNDIILASVLITISMSADDNWLGPSWHKSRDVGNDNWLSEDGTIENVSNGAVRTLPHLLETELLDPAFIRSDGSALNTNLALLNSLCSINCNLIVSCISALDRQVEVLGVNINVWENVLQ